MSDYFSQIMKEVQKAEHLGSRTLDSGVRLIGNVPHIAPEAYFHVVYPALDRTQISLIEEQVKRPLPQVLVDFYQKANGLELFGYCLSIYGLRGQMCRTGGAAWQPFSIQKPNTFERPAGAEDRMVFFGSYKWDGSKLAMLSDAPSVYRCERDSAEVLNEWSSIEEMFLNEIERLRDLFDEEGKKINKKSPTVPGS